MINIGEYTKEDMAAALNYSTDKASNITKRLTNLGYHFTTSGKGRTYRIHITQLPSYSIKDFANDYLGISARFEDRLTSFLHLLFTSGTDEYVNYSYRSLEWVCPSSFITLGEWMKKLIDCGLLVEEPMVEVYYATKREVLETYENGDYDYTQYVKFIEKEDYDKAVQAYSNCIEGFGEISKNPEVANDEAIFYANCARRDALEGWWAMKKRDCDRLHINKDWPHLSQLTSLLEEAVVYEYQKTKVGNVEEDAKRWEERWAKWEEEKAEKRKKLEEAEQKEITYTKDKKVEAETETGETVQANIPPAKIRDNGELNISDRFEDYLHQLHELYYKTGKGFYEYEEQ